MIIRKAFKLDPRRVGPLDFALTGLSTCLTLYTLCASIGSTGDAAILVVAAAVGMLVSFSFSRLAAKSMAVRMDGLLYSGLALSAYIFRDRLCDLLPDNFFTDRALQPAGFLCWMLVLCSYFTWRDFTLLFQSVPSLALFGLIGCFDIYKDATALFFIFLLCQATLMARAHGRMMMKRAEGSGYQGVENLRSGPWRWMAGPEWALASALVIVLVSLLGAPILQESAKNLGISGRLLPIRPASLKLPNTPAIFSQNHLGEVTIGRGPSTLTKTVLFRAQMNSNYYLRSEGYYEYTGHGWGTYFESFLGRPRETLHGKTLYRFADQLNPTPMTTDFSIQIIGVLPFLPVPGQAINITEGTSFYRTFDGSLSLAANVKSLPLIRGTATIERYWKPPTTVPADIDKEFNFLTDTSHIAPAVRDLALKVTQGARTDYEKAVKIQEEIEKRCRYNLNAGPTPSEEDPVEYFLFQSHEGYCDLFASAMVTMARSVGLPARYETGYLPDSETEDGYYVVKESDTHAWGEILFKDAGWVTFDATSGAAEVPDGKRGDSNDRPWYMALWVRATGIPIGVLLVGAFGWQFATRRKAGISARTQRQEAGRVYAKFESALTPLAGHPRRLSQTPGEYLHASERRLGDLRLHARELNHRFEEALFAREEPTEESVKNLRRQVAVFRSEVRAAKKKRNGE